MIKDKVYIVSYDEFRWQLLPSLLRKPKMLAWLRAMMAPILTLYIDFFNFKDQAIYKTEHNASVILLEKALNDAFDTVSRAIYINNALVLDSQHYYDVDKGDPLFFYDPVKGSPQHFYNPETFNVYGTDFTVFLPAVIRPLSSANEERLLTKIRALLDYYKLFGTKYSMVWLN